jgi:hypothetical protein
MYKIDDNFTITKSAHKRIYSFAMPPTWQLNVTCLLLKWIYILCTSLIIFDIVGQRKNATSTFVKKIISLQWLNFCPLITCQGFKLRMVLNAYFLLTSVPPQAPPVMSSNASLPRTILTFFFWISDPLCLSSSSALHFFRLFFLGPPPF